MNICTIGLDFKWSNTNWSVTFTIINRDGSSTSTGGVGFGSGAPLPQFWRSAGAINSSVANDFKHGSATNYAFYDGVNNFSDFARGENYTSTEKALHKLINIMAMKTSHC